MPLPVPCGFFLFGLALRPLLCTELTTRLVPECKRLQIVPQHLGWRSEGVGQLLEARKLDAKFPRREMNRVRQLL
jgi:hypothetical protein